MSSKVPRPYEKRARAAAERETRRRITEATVELHRTVGPARTTISAVAQRAGVQRATVYRHFPTDGDLFAACSAHWIGLHPYPAPDAWAGIEDPEQRTLTALCELYAYYRRSSRCSPTSGATRSCCPRCAPRSPARAATSLSSRTSSTRPGRRRDVQARGAGAGTGLLDLAEARRTAVRRRRRRPHDADGRLRRALTAGRRRRARLGDRLRLPSGGLVFPL